MRKTCFICLLSFFSCISIIHADSPYRDSISLEKAFKKLEQAKTCYTKSGIESEKCSKLLQEAYELSDKHGYFLKETINFLIEIENYIETRIYLNRMKIDTLPHLAKSQYHYFKGVVELQSGCDYFTQAHYSFQSALYHELLSRQPNALHLSKIYNGLGFTRMIYGANNKYPDEEIPHNNWISSDIIEALRYFKYATYYDAENEDAQANADSLLSKLNVGEFDISYSNISLNEIIRASKDTITYELLSTEEQQDTLDEINLAYLPNNPEVIIQALQEYDELLLVADISGSMKIRHPKKGVDRFTLMKELVLYILHHLPENQTLGKAIVGGFCHDLPNLFIPVGLISRPALYQSVKALEVYGSTPLIHVMKNAKASFTEKKNKKALLLLSDGMDSCAKSPLDLCMLAEDLYAGGIDIHIMSYIMNGMEEYEYAYDIYNCMVKLSKGALYEFDQNGNLVDKTKPQETKKSPLILPSIKIGTKLNMNYIEVFHTELCNK